MRAKEFIVEYKREVTLQKLGTGIATSAQREKLTAEQVIEVLEQIDPTPHKQYVPWLAKQYISGQFRTEDSNRVQETLVNFTKLKSRLPVEQRDIGRFDFYKLDELVDKLINPELSTKQTQTSTDGTFPVVPDSQVLYNGPLGQLSIPETKEASCELGSGTKWCTASHGKNMYKEYSKNGPLYVWRDKSGDKFQFHFEESQFMDARDKPIEHKLLTYFRTQHPVLKKLFAQKEAEIAKKPYVAYNYANDVIKGPFPAGEAAIATDTLAAPLYASNVLKGRWPAAEEAIATNPKAAAEYAKHIIKGRWPAAEEAIASDAESAYLYTIHVIKGRWPVGEAAIASNTFYAYLYARDILKGPWPAIEADIATDPKLALLYAKDVIKGPFPAGEEAIASDAMQAYQYAENVLKRPWPRGEAAIAKSSNWASAYAIGVIKGPFPAGEAAIAKNKYTAHDYKKFLKSIE
jgi:hypothetical protein